MSVGALRHSLAQRAGEAAIGGAAAQAAGTKVVEAVQQARALELRVAQWTHQRVAARGVQGAQALQGRENSSRHLLGELRKAGRARCGDPASEPASPEGSDPHAGPSSVPRPDTTGRPAVVERWVWDRPEQGGLAGGVRRRLVRAPCLSRTPLVALEGQVAGPVNVSYPTSSLPCFHLPTSPHSHPRNSPPGVLWVFCRRHPFRAGPLQCSGTVLACTLPRLAAAPPRGLRPQPLRASPRGQRLEHRGWKDPRGAKARGSNWPPPGTTEPGARSRRSAAQAGPEDPDPGLLRGAEAPWLDPLSRCGLEPGP